MLPFGLAFQLPVVMTLLSRSGIVSIQTFRKCRKFIILGIFILAAILTPPDVLSQIALGLPLVLLFELGIFASWLSRKRKHKSL
jgi:sec-independent protein translocase protein TatC